MIPTWIFTLVDVSDVCSSLWHLCQTLEIISPLRFRYWQDISAEVEPLYARSSNLHPGIIGENKLLEYPCPLTKALSDGASRYSCGVLLTVNHGRLRIWLSRSSSNDDPGGILESSSQSDAWDWCSGVVGSIDFKRCSHTGEGGPRKMTVCWAVEYIDPIWLT
jgi:hypothetical protein